MPLTRANVEFAHSIAKARDNRPYGYGGVWHPTNLARTTDCSGLVTHMLDALINGTKMAWSRHGISTETYRIAGERGQRGPFGTIRVNHWRDIPRDTVLTIGLQHGGGGRFSHMACDIQGTAVESSGSYGQQYGGPARHFNHPMFHEWWYLPGTTGGLTGDAPPRPPDLIFLGRDCAQYECSGERVKTLQRRLNEDDRLASNLEVDGEFGALTEAEVRQYQQIETLVIDGVAGPATLTRLRLFGLGEPHMTDSQKLDQILKDTTEIRKQLETPGDPSWKHSRKRSVRDLLNDVADKVGVSR